MSPANIPQWLKSIGPEGARLLIRGTSMTNEHTPTGARKLTTAEALKALQEDAPTYPDGFDAVIWVEWLRCDSWDEADLLEAAHPWILEVGTGHVLPTDEGGAA